MCVKNVTARTQDEGAKTVNLDVIGLPAPGTEWGSVNLGVASQQLSGFFVCISIENR
jgi:hypothetical protein